jgi:adenylosuccinate synthase
MMKNIAILGNYWGDEGKGRVIHDLSPNHDYVIRFAGGSNSGHTIYRDGKKYVHNLLPSADYRNPNIKSFLGLGMVIDLAHLLLEIERAEKDFPGVATTITVDPEAFLVLPEHKEIDKAKNAHIGSTNRGIGPAYTSKVSRSGYRIRDIMQNKCSAYQDELQKLISLGVQFRSILELRDKFMNSNLLFEGAQGILLDLNHGVYPYVSCGDSTIAGIYASGFNFMKLDEVYGVAKCYSTKVGEGPFPTELHGDEAERLRKLGNEYGATTGRPRRVGWIDLPGIEYGCKRGGITKLIITKMDILNGMDSVPVCISYNKELLCPSDFINAEPEYLQIPGWKDGKNLRQISSFINTVESITGYNVDYISAGVGDHDFVRIK